MSEIGKYTIAFHPKSEYVRPDRRKKCSSIMIRSNSLEKLLRIANKHIEKEKRNPWQYVQVMAWDAEKFDTETILFFTVNN